MLKSLQPLPEKDNTKAGKQAAANTTVAQPQGKQAAEEKPNETPTKTENVEETSTQLDKDRWDSNQFSYLKRKMLKKEAQFQGRTTLGCAQRTVDLFRHRCRSWCRPRHLYRWYRCATIVHGHVNTSRERHRCCVEVRARLIGRRIWNLPGQRREWTSRSRKQ